MKYRRSTLCVMAITMLCLLISFSTSAWAEGGYGAADKKVVAAIGDDGVQRVEITGGEYYFEPAHIIVQVNKPVELMVRKAGGFVPHNIIVKATEAGIDFDTGMGKKFKPVSFTPTRTGKYIMYCDKRFLWFKTHQHKGMEGIIEVVE